MYLLIVFGTGFFFIDAVFAPFLLELMLVPENLLLLCLLVLVGRLGQFVDYLF